VLNSFSLVSYLVYLLCFMSLCVSFLSHCVLFFCHMGLVAYARERHSLNSEYHNAIFSQYSQKHIFKTYAFHTFPSPAISTPAISTPAFWCRDFHSRDFHSHVFSVPQNDSSDVWWSQVAMHRKCHLFLVLYLNLAVHGYRTLSGLYSGG